MDALKSQGFDDRPLFCGVIASCSLAGLTRRPTQGFSKPLAIWLWPRSSAKSKSRLCAARAVRRAGRHR